VHGVVKFGEDRYVSYCRCEPKSCKNTSLSREDLFIFELDWRKLCDAIATALELSLGYLPTAEVSHTAIVGRHNPAAGEFYHAVLVIAGDALEFRDRLEAISVRFHDPFILLSPTRSNITQSAEMLLRETKSVVLPLNEILKFEMAGKLECVRSPFDLLREFNKQHVPSLRDSGPADRPYIPPDTTWAQIEIGFLSGLDVKLVIRGKAHNTDFIRMKLARMERRNWVPSEQGELLRKFVDGNGYVRTSFDARATVKKQCQRLTVALRAYLPIQGGDPISPLDDHSGWRANFRVTPSI
jgi:hypothetical protein